MSRELINRITIKKDGIYVSTHSSNDDAPYHSVKVDFLTNKYNEEGQKGLNKEVIGMMFNYAELRGSHHSLQKYLYAYNSEYANNICKEYTDKINMYYEMLNEDDRKSIWSINPTPKAKEYNTYNDNLRNDMYSKIAKKCDEYDLINNLVSNNQDEKSFEYYENIIDTILEVSDDYNINFDSYCPFDSFGSDEESKNLGMYSLSEYYKEILQKNSIDVENITANEKSAGKYIVTIDNKYNFEINAWETLENVVDNIETMIDELKYKDKSKEEGIEL